MHSIPAFHHALVISFGSTVAVPTRQRAARLGQKGGVCARVFVLQCFLACCLYNIDGLMALYHIDGLPPAAAGFGWWWSALVRSAARSISHDRRCNTDMEERS